MDKLVWCGVVQSNPSQLEMHADSWNWQVFVYYVYILYTERFMITQFLFGSPMLYEHIVYFLFYQQHIVIYLKYCY